MFPLIVVETSFPWSPKGLDRTRPLGESFPVSVEGQKAFLAAEVKIVRSTVGGRGKGIYYWGPAWIATCSIMLGNYWIRSTV